METTNRVTRLGAGLSLLLGLWVATAPSMALGQYEVTWTTGADFASGVGEAVEFDSVADQLRLTGESTTSPYLYATNYRYGTVSKIDTLTGNEVARYPSCLNGIGNDNLCPTSDPDADLYVHKYCDWKGEGHCPSRTAVDLDGNIWVANRAFKIQATLTKIAGSLSRCIDRNGNGVIETSTDLDGDGNIDVTENSSMPHTGVYLTDEWLGQADECVLFSVAVGENDWVARGLAVGGDNSVWVGFHNKQKIVVVDPNDGATLNTYDVSAKTYGLAFDSLGYVYNSEISGGRVFQVLGATGAVVKTIDTPYRHYGLAVDATNQTVWLGIWENRGALLRVNHLTGTYTLFQNSAWSDAGRTRGVALDLEGDVWIANYNNKQVGRFDPETEAWIASYPTDQNAVGVGVDPDGKIWAVGMGNPGRATRIDPATGDSLTSAALGTNPYSYSDLTGYQLTQFVATVGSWTNTFSGPLTAQSWKALTWNTETDDCGASGCAPPGTEIEVEVRAYDGDTPSGTYQKVENGSAVGDVRGQNLEVRVALRAQSGSDISPVLTDIQVVANREPRITGVDPTEVLIGSIEEVTLTGINFHPDTIVQLDRDLEVTQIVVVNENEMRFSVVLPPSLEPGAVDITLQNSEGTSLPQTIQAVLPIPTLAGVSPTYVSPGSTTNLEFTGTGLYEQGDLTPSAGTALAPSYPSATEINVAYAAPSAPTIVSWVYSNDAGQTGLTAATVVYGPTSVSPAQIEVGATAGVQIAGVGLSVMDVVDFGPHIEVLSVVEVPGGVSVEIVAADLPDAVGPTDLAMSRPDLGVSHTLTDALTIVPRPPVLSSVNPALAPVGATLSVDLIGANLDLALNASFGEGITAVVTSTSPNTATVAISIDANADLGFRDVSVTTSYGADTLPDGFGVSGFAVLDVTPDQAYLGEFTTVTVSGGGFDEDTTFDFGPNVTITDIQIPNGTTAILEIYPGFGATAGPIDVAATRNGLESTLNDAIVLAWRPLDLVEVDPTIVSPGDVTTLTLTGTNFSPIDELDFGLGTGVVEQNRTGTTTWVAEVAIPTTPGLRDITISNPGSTDVLEEGLTIFGPTTVSEYSMEQGSSILVEITGFGFTSGMDLDFGPGINAIITNVVDDQLLIAQLVSQIAAPLGPRDVVLTRFGPEATGRLEGAFTVVPPGGGDILPPTLTGCGPSVGTAGDTLTTRCEGSNFTAEIDFDFGDSITVVSVTPLSSSKVDIVLAIDPLAPEGYRDITATTQYGSDVLEDGFQVMLPPLSITGIIPEPVFLPGSTVTLTLLGTGISQLTTADFVSGATVITSDPVSQNELVLQSEMGDVPGVYSIVVTNGPQSLVLSNAVTVLGLTSLDPDTMATGETKLFSLVGGLPPGTTVTAESEEMDVLSGAASGTTQSINVSASDLTPLGPQDLYVTYKALTYTEVDAIDVTPGPPSVSAVEPDEMEINQTREVVLTGVNLSGCSVTVAGAASSAGVVATAQTELVLSIASGNFEGFVDLELSCPGGTTALDDAIEVFDGANGSAGPEDSLASVSIVEPTVLQLFPAPAGSTDVAMVFEVENFTPGVDGTIRFFINGVANGEQSTTDDYVFSNLSTGRKHLTVALFGTDGELLDGPQTRQTVQISVGGSCSAVGDCEDNNVCSNMECVNSLCKYGPTEVPPGAVCCTADMDCKWGWSCGDDGLCRECSRHSDCFDGIACSLDTCVQHGICQTVMSGNCCLDDSYCDDGLSCTTDACVGNSCQNLADPDCCDVNDDCTPPDACTVAVCVDNDCLFGPVGSECCLSNTDCDDGQLCTDDICDLDANTCLHLDPDPLDCCEPGDPNCCNDDFDCDDKNKCSIDVCNLDTHQCEYTQIPIEVKSDCCVNEIHCDDGIPCNLDRCVGGDCRYGPNPAYTNPVNGYNSCCVDDPALAVKWAVYLNCDDKNNCTVDSCNPDTNQCEHTLLGDSNCCTTSDECDDNDPTTFNVCQAAQCVYLPIRNYCEIDADCEDGQPCTIGKCTEKWGCKQVLKPNCCTNNKSCIDGDPCTLDICDPTSNTCSHAENETCCQSNDDCPAPPACIDAICANGRCIQKPQENCCTSDSDCAVNHPCFEGFCSFGECQQVPTTTSAEICCLEATECDDGDACTVDFCSNQNLCTHAPIQGCCASSQDCFDGDACTLELCVDGECVYDVQSGCCEADSDCDDGDPCTTDDCESGACTNTPEGNCGWALPFISEFDDADAAVESTSGWVTESVGPPTAPEWTINDGAAVLDNPPADNNGLFRAWLKSPVFDTGGAETVTIQAHLAADSALPWTELELFFSPGDGTSWTVATPALPLEAWDSRMMTWTTTFFQGSSTGQIALRYMSQPDQTEPIRVTRFVVEKGTPPAVTGGTTSLEAPMMDQVKPFYDAVDTDGQTVTFSLLAAPSWITLGAYTATPAGFATQVVVGPLITAGVDAAETLQPFHIWLRALDGILETRFRIDIYPQP